MCGLTLLVPCWYVQGIIGSVVAAIGNAELVKFSENEGEVGEIPELSELYGEYIYTIYVHIYIYIYIYIYR